jgi:hypothetical protein
MQPCFPPGEQLGEDQDLWFRLSERGNIRFSNEKNTAFYRLNVGDSLTSKKSTVPLPALQRLRLRANKYPIREKEAVLHLFGVHLLHVAWVNCLGGFRLSALCYLMQVRPTVRIKYWLRIAFAIFLPSTLLRQILNKFKNIYDI